MDAGFFKGTSTDQDKRFSDKEAKLLKSTKFPPEFDRKVDMRKVNLQVIRPWIVKKVVELVGFEDEVVVEYAVGLLDDKSKPIPDPRLIQINLTGFLTSSAGAFVAALWNLLLEAQDSPAGVPKSFVEEKKQEMRANQQRFDARPTGFSDQRNDRHRDFADRGGASRGRGGGRRFEDKPPNDMGRGRARDSGWGARGGRPRVPSRSRSPPQRQRESAEKHYKRDRSPRRSPPRSSRNYSPIPASGARSRSPHGRRPSPRRRSPAGDHRRRAHGSPSPLSARSRSRSISPTRRRRPSTSPHSHRNSRRRRPRSGSTDSRSRSSKSENEERSRYSKRRRSRSRRRSLTRSASPSQERRVEEGRHLSQADSDFLANGRKSELKIKGSASTKDSENHKFLADRTVHNEDPSKHSSEQKERELKEAALRNKLVKSKGRKDSSMEEE